MNSFHLLTLLLLLLLCVEGAASRHVGGTDLRRTDPRFMYASLAAPEIYDVLAERLLVERYRLDVLTMRGIVVPELIGQELKKQWSAVPLASRLDAVFTSDFLNEVVSETPPQVGDFRDDDAACWLAFTYMIELLQESGALIAQFSEFRDESAESLYQFEIEKLGRQFVGENERMKLFAIAEQIALQNQAHNLKYRVAKSIAPSVEQLYGLAAAGTAEKLTEKYADMARLLLQEPRFQDLPHNALISDALVRE